LTSDSLWAGTAAEPASQAGDRAEQTGGEHASLPLLRLSGWELDKQYDKNNPVCIHYDFRWKISQRENIRVRTVFSDTDPDLVLAPSDFWNAFLLQDEDKIPGDAYIYEETIIEISIERSRQRGLSKRFPKLQINWQMVDEHLEGLGDLSAKGCR
jgi:hypothetical protein